MLLSNYSVLVTVNANNIVLLTLLVQVPSVPASFVVYFLLT